MNTLSFDTIQHILSFMNNETLFVLSMLNTSCYFLSKEFLKEKNKKCIEKIKKSTIRENICIYAIKNNYFSLLQYAKKECNCPWSKNLKGIRWLLIYAIRSGNLKMVKFIWEYPSFPCEKITYMIKDFKEIVANSYQYNHFDIVKYFHFQKIYKNHKIFDEWACAYAAKYNNLEALKWLRENDYPWNFWTYNYGVLNNNLDILNYAYENRCKLKAYVFRTAAGKRNFEIMEWLKEKNCPWNFTVKKKQIIHLKIKN